MKKLILTVMILCLALAGCGNTPTEPASSDSSSDASAESSTDEQVETPSADETEDAQETLLMTIDPQDEYDKYGFTHFAAESDAVYRFEAAPYEELTWAVYILEEEFTDAERYIPHTASPAIISETPAMDAELEVAAGQWVYVYCSANGWTGTEIPEGAHLNIYVQ